MFEDMLTSETIQQELKKTIESTDSIKHLSHRLPEAIQVIQFMLCAMDAIDFSEHLPPLPKGIKYEIVCTVDDKENEEILILSNFLIDRVMAGIKGEVKENNDAPTQ